MCYSLEISAFFACVDILLAIYLWRRDIDSDRAWAVLSLLPGFVQIGDLALWYEHDFDPNYQRGSCSAYNQRWTAFLVWFITVQPICYWLSTVYYRWHKLNMKWPIITLSDIVISLGPPILVIGGIVQSNLNPDFNPCLTENPYINYCSHLTEDNHWNWTWGLDRWGGGMCGRTTWETVFGLSYTRDDPAFYARENRLGDLPFLLKLLCPLIYSPPARWLRPRPAGYLTVSVGIVACIIALQTTSYPNMWCFLCNSAGFVGVLCPHICRMLGYESNKVAPNTAVKKRVM